MSLKLKEVNSLWYSTEGKFYQESCDITTEDEGYTFICKRHNKMCEFDEGVFCPVTHNAGVTND